MKDPLHDSTSDLESLRRIGRERGFPMRLRKKIWPALLNIESDSIPLEEHSEPHPEERQVLLDTKRSFTNCIPSHVPSESIATLKDDLQYLISQVLRRNRWLNYYQGYHDVAQLILFTTSQSQAVYVLERMSILYLRDFMLSTLSPSMSMLRMVHQIVGIADPEYSLVLQDVEPYYSVPALLTWWTHSLQTYTTACRLFDFLLSTDPILIVYTIAAVTMMRKKKVLDCDGDPDMTFMILSKGLLDDELEDVLSASWDLYESVKPKQLRHWKSISQHSCLKTFSSTMISITKSNAEDRDGWVALVKQQFDAQEVEIREEEARKAQKTAAPKRDTRNLSIIALSVGVLAVGIAWYIQQQQR